MSNNGFVTIRNNSKIIHVVTEAIDKQTVKFSHPDAITSLTLRIPNDSDADNFVVYVHLCELSEFINLYVYTQMVPDTVIFVLHKGQSYMPYAVYLCAGSYFAFFSVFD